MFLLLLGWAPVCAHPQVTHALDGATVSVRILNNLQVRQGKVKLTRQGENTEILKRRAFLCPSRSTLCSR